MSDTTERFKVGILGNCCTHGLFVTWALQAEAEAQIVGGWEDDPRRHNSLRDAVGMDLVDDPHALIENPEIDIIALTCAPNDKAQWVEQAASRSKHIFLNKPMCESMASALAIEASIKHHGVQLVHDIPVIRFHPVAAKLLHDVRTSELGRPIHYAHSWGMTFSPKFDLAHHWPERLDPPQIAGGGEMSNMGVYAIDYMVAMWGMPQAVQAKWQHTWDIYKNASVENFGQILCDYGDFFAILAVGKQQLPSLPDMPDPDSALKPEFWPNSITLQFANTNLTVMPFHNRVIRDGQQLSDEEYLDGHQCLTPFQQLTQAIRQGSPPDSDVTCARQGIEVLMAAYTSIAQEGARITLPLVKISHPLVASST